MSLLLEAALAVLAVWVLLALLLCGLLTFAASRYRR